MNNRDRIIVVDHDPLWANQFREIKEVLSKQIDKYICNIEHVGSTSIKGLKAKPILDIDIIIYLASFYENDKNHEKAITLLKKGLKNSPGNTSLLFKLGTVQDKAGFNKESLAAMKKIIEIDPKDAGALNYLGYSYADQGVNLDEALLLIKRAYDLRPDDGYITDSLGWIYFKKGNYKKAVEYLEKAAELTSHDTIVSDHLGDAYQKANQLQEALSSYQKALSNTEDKNRVPELQKKIDAVLKKINE